MSLINIHQQATFYYLKEIQHFCEKQNDLVMPLQKPYRELNAVLETINKLEDEFNCEKDYAKLYRQFQSKLELVAKYELSDEAKRKSATMLDPLFIVAFENDSKIQDKIAAKIIQPGVSQSDETLKDRLESLSTHPNRKTHIKHPDNPLNAFFSSMLGFKYHPLKRNNVSYVNFDEPTNGPTYLRMGAQTQKRDVVNPSFQRYALANARSMPSDNTDDSCYQQVYINLLKRGQKEQDTHKKGLSKMADRFVRHSEGKRSNALENLNFAKDLKLAVITLPADGEFFLGDFSMKKGKAKHNTHQSLQTILNNLKDSIQQNRNDFYIPREIKRRLFGQNFSNGQLEALFMKAVKKEIGEVQLEDLYNIEVSPEKRNAILFQFVKFELTHEILKLANPKKANFSCKDGIDRGAVHSLWYYLNLRYEEGKPMVEAEFVKYLDASAIVVKYRPINHNKNIIWNALKYRIAADPDFSDAHPWARQWVISNTPDDVALETDWQTSCEQKSRLKFC